jgi:hypothetical protein
MHAAPPRTSGPPRPALHAHRVEPGHRPALVLVLGTPIVASSTQVSSTNVPPGPTLAARPREGGTFMGAKKSGGRKYGPGASRKVERAMGERKQGTLVSGRSGRKVTSRKQAIAIGLSEARREGKKVPKRPTSSQKRR